MTYILLTVFLLLCSLGLVLVLGQFFAGNDTNRDEPGDQDFNSDSYHRQLLLEARRNEV